VPLPQAKPVGPATPEATGTGLYLHVPFCASTCDFCAFYQEKPHRADLLRYLDGIEREIVHWREEWAKPPQAGDPLLAGLPSPDGLTVFFGGGTPGLLPTGDLVRLCESVRRTAPLPIVEWTVEMAPSTVKADKIRAMLEAGVTRISLGVQSFNPRLLDALGRQHSPAVVRRAFDTFRAAGCGNINLDLIFAVPGQSLADWQADLRKAIALAPEHLSTYCLTFEEDTKLWVKLSQGIFRRDIATEANLYRFTWETLESAGYPQYEVSNFARPGYACRHNLDTWRMGTWRGVGPSAASQWQGHRWCNPANLDQWLAGLDAASDVPPSKAEEIVRLTPEILAGDALIFGLRLNDGIDLDALQARFPDARWDRWEMLWDELAREALLWRNKSTIGLTSEGRLIADAVAVRILESV